jgi:hypothetical protein
MTEVAEEPGPLVVRAFLSDEFTRSARNVARTLEVDDSWIASIRDPFVLLVDEEGIWLCPEDAERKPYISICWPIIGKLRDAWGLRGGKGEAVAGAVFTIVTAGQLGVAGRESVAVLCAPILRGSDPVELRIPVDSIDGIARDAEKRRPRTKWGPMRQWVPDA